MLSVKRASAVIVVDDVAQVKRRKAVGEEQAEIAEVYGEVEKNAHFLVESADVPAQTFSADDTKNLVSLLNILPGVFAMNQLLPKLPDLSANIGTIRTEGDHVAIQYFPRASADARLRELMAILPVYAELTGCDIELASRNRPGRKIRTVNSRSPRR